MIRINCGVEFLNVYHEVLRIVEESRDEIILTLKELVKRPSYTTMEGHFDDEKSVVSYIYKFLSKNLDKQAKIYTQRIIHDNGKTSDNIIVVLGSGPKLFLIDAHVDTVSEGSKSLWFDANPFSAEEGVAEYVGNGKVVVRVRDNEAEVRIRDLMEDIWRRRRSKCVDIIYGRGSYDNKGSVASVMFMLKTLKTLIDMGYELQGTVIASFTVDEEGAQRGAKEYLKWLKRNYLASRAKSSKGYVENVLGVITEGSYGFKVLVGHRGIVWYILRTKGVSAHAATPHLGRNAVLDLARILVLLTDRYHELLSELNKFMQDNLLGNPIMTPGTTIVGGGIQSVEQVDGRVIRRSDINIVPDWAEATIDFRTVRGVMHPEDKDEIPTRIARTLENMIRKYYPDIEFEIEIMKDSVLYPIGLCSSISECEEDPDIAMLRTIARNMLGYDPGLGIAYGASHGYLFTYDADVKTIVEFGPAGGGAHAVHEYVEIDQVVRGSAIYAVAAINYFERREE